MKQFRTILRFELNNYFKNKVFTGVTIFLVAVIAAVMFSPRITSAFKSGDTSKEADRLPVMLVAAENQEWSEIIRGAFSDTFDGYEVQVSENNTEDIKKQISSGAAECAFVFDDLSSYTYYVNNLSMYDENTYTADEVLSQLYRATAFASEGIAPERVNEILNVQITHQTQNLGKDQVKNFFYTYIMIFALYMVILLYGQMVATNVATEKSSRAMELLITSAKPVSMMFGKVIASCIAGFIQLAAVFGSAFLFFNLNKSYWAGNMIINSIFDMPLNLLLYMLLFFVLGFFIYAFMYGAIGSTASKLEDINTSVMPITMLFISGFIIVMFSMSGGNIDNTLMRVCSFIPFTSPMAMFARIAMSSVPAYEIIISVAVLIASVFGIGVLSAKIYRAGVLLYGTTPKIGSILKTVFK